MNNKSAILAMTTVVVLMAAAAAQGLAGENTVFSDDIVDGQVKHIDIKENTIGSSRMLDNSVHSVKISDGSIVAGDMADEAVTGPKIGFGAVTGAKVLDGSLAIGSDVGSTRNDRTIDFGSIAAGACVSAQLYQVSGSSAGNDAVAVTPDQSDWPNSLIATTQADVAGDISAVSLIVCNVSGVAVDPDSTVFHYSVMP